MSILTGPAIVSAVLKGEIEVDPWDEALVNPASLDLRLGHLVRLYCPQWARKRHPVYSGHTVLDEGRHAVRDLKREWPSECREIPADGLVLNPDELCLLHTAEVLGTDRYVTCIDGKSSLARAGITCHLVAGYGDPGFRGQYTLEVTTVYPVRIYAGMRFAQARFHETVGEPARYAGHYRGRDAVGPVPSMVWKQFEEDGK